MTTPPKGSLDGPRMLEVMRRHVASVGGVCAASRELAISSSSVSRVLQGQRPVPPRMAQWAGYDRVTVVGKRTNVPNPTPAVYAYRKRGGPNGHV